MENDTVLKVIQETEILGKSVKLNSLFITEDAMYD